MRNILDVFTQIAEKESIKITKLEQILGASKGVLSRAVNNNTDIQAKWLMKLVENYPQYNPDWILTGNEPMLKSNTTSVNDSRNLIPFYEDVSSIGGSNLAAETNAVYRSKILIDAGDWFKGATAAIRHYNDSMVEYQSGCILAIRELNDKTEIEWGRNYVVETSEMRVTKKLAEIDDEFIMGYSTNKETYFDGTLIHQPIKIRKEKILKIARVLGSVNKEESTGMVQLI